MQSDVVDEESEHDLGDGPSATQSRLSGMTDRTSGNYDRDRSGVYRRNGLPRVLTYLLVLVG